MEVRRSVDIPFYGTGGLRSKGLEAIIAGICLWLNILVIFRLRLFSLRTFLLIVMVNGLFHLVEDIFRLTEEIHTGDSEGLTYANSWA